MRYNSNGARVDQSPLGSAKQFHHDAELIESSGLANNSPSVRRF